MHPEPDTLSLMRLFWRLLVGGLGTILAILGIMTNVTPQQAHSNLSSWFVNPPSWLLPPKVDDYGQLFFFTLGAVLLVVAFWPLVSRRPLISRHPETLRIDPQVVQAVQAVNANDLLELREACRIAYERLRQVKSIYAMAAERLGHQGQGETREDAILNWFAYSITRKAPIYAKHPPSTLREVVHPDEFKKSSIRFDALYYHGEKEPRYTDLEIHRSDLDRVIEQLKDARIDESPTFIPAKDAVAIAYDKLHDTEWGRYYKGWKAGHPEEKQVEIGASMLVNSGVPLYGIEPMSSTHRPVNTSDIEFEMALWRERGTDGMVLLRRNKNEVLCRHLAFNHGDLTAFIETTLREGEAAFNRGFNRTSFQKTPTKDAAVLRLTQLRSEGVVIRNDAAKVLYTTHLDTWSRRVNNWMHEVITTLRYVSEADSEWFATLDTVPNARVQVPVRLTGDTDVATFVSTYNQHDFRLLRLEKLLMKYGVAA